MQIVAGHVEKCLRDRQWGAQFVGGIGCESLLFGDMCFEPREHGVEGVGELAELILRPSNWIRWERDPVAAMRVASVMRISGASMRPARIHPQETEHQEERQNDGRGRSESAQEERVVRH